MMDKQSSFAAPSVVVISGGTAANSLVSAFQNLAGSSQLAYVLPIRYHHIACLSEVSRLRPLIVSVIMAAQLRK